MSLLPNYPQRPYKATLPFNFFCSSWKAATTGSPAYTCAQGKVGGEVSCPTDRLLENKGSDSGAAASWVPLTEGCKLNLPTGAVSHLWLS